MRKDSDIMTPMREMRVKAGRDITAATSDVITKLFAYACNEASALTPRQRLDLEDMAIVLMRVKDHMYAANARAYEKLNDKPMTFSPCDEDNHRTFIKCRQKRIEEVGLPKESLDFN